jgi:hypothetical protein
MTKVRFASEAIINLIEFDLEFYRRSYSDLSAHSNTALIEHYAKHGYWEGRLGHPLCLRENFIKHLEGRSVLEIGPFVNPTLTHSGVKYLDILSTAELRDRALRLGLSIDGLKEIDFVSRDGSLRNVSESFDLIFSSHNLEHQPDLIGHLNDVSSKLNKSGRYAMLVPNARYCFDATLPLSKISEIFTAHHERRTHHTIGSVIEHRALTTHNNSIQHWENSRDKYKYDRLDPSRIEAAVSEYRDANGSYIDVHAWQFEPHSLSDILHVLIKLGYIEFSSVKCWGGVYGRNEFALELSK